jgi:hypothetical protein
LLAEYAKRSANPADPATEAMFRMTPPPADLIFPITALITVEIAFDVNAKNAVEILLGRAFDRTNVRDASVIYKNVNPTLLQNRVECRFN